MEETIGALWDKLVTKIAYTGYPEAQVHLEQIAPLATVLFHALGGEAGLQIQASSARAVTVLN